MDWLWSPWRYGYVSRAAPAGGCIFCQKQSQDDETALIVHRARQCYVVLNLFPYTSGHLMIVPHEHVSSLAEASEESAQEMMTLAREAERHLRALYRPQGLNIGMNLGECAGAGVAGHIHLHVLPRWPGDVNFMTSVAETRVAPEDLKDTWRKLRGAFSAGGV